MRIIQILHLDGPNAWSRSPVLEALVDLEELDVSSATLPGLYERLSTWLPTLIEHKCGIGERGGFLLRVREGTWPGHIMEHVAIELHELAGWSVAFGKTREMSPPGVYKVVLRCVDRELCQGCLLAARDLLLAAIYDLPFDLPAVLADLKRLVRAARLEPGLQAVEEAALARELPVRRLDDRRGLVLGQGRKAKTVLVADPALPTEATAGAFLDRLFPAGDKGRIPVVNIIGAGDRTSTARLLAARLEGPNRRVGLACGEGLFVGGRRFEQGYRAHRAAAWTVLGDCYVDLAVLEASGPSVSNEGLGFDRCDVAVVTGVTDDILANVAHTGHLDRLYDIRRCGIDVLLPTGIAVLDALDPRATDLAALTKGEVIYYCSDPDNQLLRQHVQGGGRGATVEGGRILLLQGDRVIEVADWPAIVHDSAPYAVRSAKDALAAEAAAWAMGCHAQD
jgi:hypothetical protein